MIKRIFFGIFVLVVLSTLSGLCNADPKNSLEGNAGEYTLHYGYTCPTCHDPGSLNELQLRFPPKELCMQCHTSKGATVGEAEFRPQAEMFADSIMYKDGIGCHECHLKTVRSRYVDVYEIETFPKTASHTFEPNLERCISPNCHPGKDVNWTKKAMRVGQTEITTLLEEVGEELSIVNNVLFKMYPSWDGSKESIKDAPTATLEAVDKYIQANYNIEFVKADNSSGFHNRAKAEHMLEEVEPLTEEALELLGAKPEPSPKGVCGPIAVLLLAMLPVAITRLRKKDENK